MHQDELLRRVVEILERLEIPYFVTGSMATIYYGEPRFTADIDIVVDLDVLKAIPLAEAFPADDFYVSVEAARRAAQRRTQFNILHPRSGLKVDLMVSDRSEFDRSRFSRARSLRPSPDFEASFAAPEDVILKKMEYFREGKSDKHLRDIAGVLRIAGSAIDRSYIERWAERLGLLEIWRQIRAEHP